jgi:hypothetical protein
MAFSAGPETDTVLGQSGELKNGITVRDTGDGSVEFMARPEKCMGYTI